MQQIPRSALMRRQTLACAVACALLGGGYLGSAAATSAVDPIRSEIATLPSFADVAERVTPAVVNVTVSTEQETTLWQHGHPALPEQMPLPDYFKRFFEEQAPLMPRRVQGQGSGFLVDAEGHIVTNNHVIEGATEVTVVMNDGSTHQATVVGRDEKTDLALLKIQVDRPLPFVQLDDSGSARVGDWVLAVGNPFGLGGSVNAGIISARGRDIQSGPYDDYLQIDAAINRGNSGGPLFDTRGRVIGVNTAIYSPTGGNVGIGFAIPAETVAAVVADLRAHGRVERGWLGVQIQEVSAELAAALGLDAPRGVLIADVLPDGPARGTDLRAGDVILSVSGTPIAHYKDLPKRIAATDAGTRIELEVWRDGKSRVVPVTIGAMPGDEALAAAPGATPDDLEESRLGLYLAPLTPELRQREGWEADRQGVYVAQVAPNSPAALAGIRPGSLISMVGADPVSSPRQVQDAIRKAAAARQPAVVLRVERDGRALFVAVPLAA